ncbi:MAG: carboxynorspermidine decarboxylase [Bilophila sp.]
MDIAQTPCFVVDEGRLRANAAVLDEVQRRTGARILLALKAFAMWDVFPLLSRSKGDGPLYGCCASSPDEARLARETFGGEVHAFAAAYSEGDVQDLLQNVDHLLFNSFAQWKRFRGLVAAQDRAIECGIRVNPEHSEGAIDIYNPCAAGSRLGVRKRDFDAAELAGLSGLHFHTLCEQGADALERTLTVFEARFGMYLEGMKWVNFGGGHHITRQGYDLELLCRCIERVQDRYGVQVYLEPGEAVALDAGVLVSTVLDIVQADIPVAILDTSAAAHMPDVLEMPYRPQVMGAGLPDEKAWTARLAGKSCLAGDVIGTYSFDMPLRAGDRLVFTDMAIYSMVKTTTFNGLRLPSIARWNPDTNEIRLVRSFGYEDCKGRLS